MRVAFAASALAGLLVLAPAALAQRGASRGGSFGGGRASGFARPSFGGGFARPSFGSPGRIPGFAPRAFATAPRMAWAAPGRAFAPTYDRGWGRGGNGGRSPWNHDRGRYRSPYRGGYGYPGYGSYVNSWELLPWDFGYPGFTGYGDDDDDSGQAAQGQVETAPPDESYPPPGDGYRPDYDSGPPPMMASAAPAPAVPVAPEPQLMLIFKDGHQQPIRNYVLTPSTVIDLDQAASGRQTRIPLDDLNLPATERAAQQAGLDFHPPA